MPIQLQASHSGDDHGDEARIEIIPLIDIMFFLLASFIMVSLSMTQLSRVPIDLPAAATGIPDTKVPPFQITVDSHGILTWDGKIITPTEITTHLRQQTTPSETRVLISADAESRHKSVLSALDAVRAAGIEKVSFESKSPQP